MQLLSTITSVSKRPWFILSIGFTLLFVRAWPRLLYPEVWDEDGVANLYSFFNHGIVSLIEPVNGYLLLVPKLITILSASISISEYPFISTILAWAVTLAVFYIIATAPLHLYGGILLAVTCLLVPSDAEVFGLPLYTFWWAAILLFILIFWDIKSTDWKIRFPIIIFASLSSPVCIAVLPLYWLRAWYLRKNIVEINLALVITLCAILQVWILYRTNQSPALVELAELHQIIPKFLGAYLIGNLLPNFTWIFGLILLLFLTVTLCRQYRNYILWLLIGLWCLAVFMSISRVPVNIIHHALAGPRYFFFPFIITSWILLQIWFIVKEKWLQNISGMLLVIAALNTIPVLYRTHDRLNWQKHLNQCATNECGESYSMPVHLAGSIADTWRMNITKKQCQNLLIVDPFYQKHDIIPVPYCVLAEKITVTTTQHLLNASSIVKNEWTGTDYYSIATGKNTLPNFKVIGSFKNTDTESGELVLHLKRGDKIWYRSEPLSKKQRIIIYEVENKFTQTLDTLPPTSEWVLLEFSNRNLPNEFDVKFVDGGGGWGEWSAVGLIDQ